MSPRPPARVRVTAPLRADLAGGTLDIWPINRCLPGAVTVNAALSLAVRVDLARGGRGITILGTDGRTRRYPGWAALARREGAGLVERTLAFAAADLGDPGGLSLRLASDSPRGAGLGGSSTLTVALLAGLRALAGKRVHRPVLIPVAKDLETAHIQTTTGDQDYYPACYGGVMAIHYGPGGDRRVGFPVPPGALERHLLLVYSHAPRFSGLTNWQVVKGFVEGRPAVRRGLARIAALSARVADALARGRWGTAARLVAEEGALRGRLHPQILTPAIRDLLGRARRAGAWGGKVCGAGGGGCVLVATPARARARVQAALEPVATVLPFRIVRRPLRIHRPPGGREEGPGRQRFPR